MLLTSGQAIFTDEQDQIVLSDVPPQIPKSDVLWLDTSVNPNVLKKWDGQKWNVVNDTSGLNETVETLQTDFTVEQGKINALIKETHITNKDGSESTLKDKYLQTEATVDGITTTIKDVKSDVEGLSAKYTEIKATADGVSSVVSSNKTKWDQASNDAKVAKESVNNSVSNIIVQFSLSDSRSEYIQFTPWNSVPPQPVDGKFLWQRNKTIYVDPTIPEKISDPVCVAGQDGANGKDGTNGTDGKDGKDAVVLNIHSSNGMTFKNTCVNTVLTVEIVSGNNIVTTASDMKRVFGENAKLVWECKRPNEKSWTPIQPQDPRLKDEGFIFTLTTGDIFTHMIFNCGLDF